MTVPNDFLEAVRKKDILGIRLMLKNSLVLDTSFYKYDEMIKCINQAGIDIWMEPKSIDRKEKPWSTDLMNYELAAIMNDFSKDHMNYLKEIVSYVYGTAQRQYSHDVTNGNTVQNLNSRDYASKESGFKNIGIDPKPSQYAEYKFDPIQIENEKKQVIVALSNMTKLLKNARIDKEEKLSSSDIGNIAWDSRLTLDLKREALEIIRICDYLQGGK